MAWCPSLCPQGSRGQKHDSPEMVRTTGALLWNLAEEPIGATLRREGRTALCQGQVGGKKH